MSPIRSIVLLSASLAAGLSARLMLQTPPDNNPPGSSKPDHTTATSPATPRPDLATILATPGPDQLRLLLAWLRGADETELRQMANELILSFPAETLRLRLLMARWAEVNPASLLAWTGQIPSNAVEFCRTNAIEAWAREDFDKAWAPACTKHPDARVAALLGLTSVDPAKCLVVLRNNPALLKLNGGFTF